MSGIHVEHAQKFGPADLTTGTAFPGFGTTGTTAAAGNDTRIVNSVQNTRAVNAGSGLSGGGDLSADRTLAVANVTGMHEANATEMQASPVVTHAVGMVVVPFTTLATTGSVGFITDRKYEIISTSCHKVGTTGSTNDTIDLQVDAASILSGGTPASLNAKTAGAFVAMSLDPVKQVIAQGATVTLVGSAGTTDCATRGYLQLIPVS